MIQRVVGLNLTAVTLGISVNFTVDYGDNTSWAFSLNDSTQIINKSYDYPGIYTLTVYGLNPLSISLDITNPPECNPPDVLIQNGSNEFSNPQIAYRSSTINLAGAIVFNCSYNYTLTSKWSLIEVNSSSGEAIGDAFNLSTSSFFGQYGSDLSVLGNTLFYGTYQFTYQVTIVYTFNRGLTFLTLQSEASTFVRIESIVELR
jgi:hypothetical protein